MDPRKITRKNQFGTLAITSSRLVPANTSRAVGCSKPTGHAHAEKVRNLSHPPLLARTHACLCTQKTQASRRICIGKGAGQPPVSVAGPRDGATLRLRRVWRERSSMHLEARSSMRQPSAGHPPELRPDAQLPVFSRRCCAPTA